MNIEKVRKKCIQLMAEKGFLKRGGQTDLAGHLKMNRNSISMALSGYRSGPGSLEILKAIQKHLLYPKERE